VTGFDIGFCKHSSHLQRNCIKVGSVLYFIFRLWIMVSTTWHGHSEEMTVYSVLLWSVLLWNSMNLE